MLKRLSEKTSFYNVNQWNKEYEISQYYKKNHCLHPPINFNKFKKINLTNKNRITRKKFFSKTHYASTGKLDYTSYPSFGIVTSTKKKKKFEDFNYRDLNLDNKNKSDIKYNKDKENERLFKKIAEMENEEKQENNGNIYNNIKIVENIVDKKEENMNEKNEEKKENGDGGIKEQKKNNRDDKEEKEEKEEKKDENEDKKE